MSATTIDTSVAEAYEALLVPGIFGPWAEAIVNDVHIRDGMKVLDIACGTGGAARYAARRCGDTFGIDLDPGMIAIAKSIAERDGFVADYRCGSATELPYESESFAVVFCFHGLQYFPDRAKAMTEMHRVLRPGGKVVIATWSELPTCKGHWALAKALERRNLDATTVRKPCAISDPIALQAHAERAGFKQATVRVQEQLTCFASARDFVDAIARGAPSSRLALAKVPADEWEDFLAEVAATLAPWQHGNKLEFPMTSNVLVALRQ